jgi:hypothetical protein
MRYKSTQIKINKNDTQLYYSRVAMYSHLFSIKLEEMNNAGVSRISVEQSLHSVPHVSLFFLVGGGRHVLC